MRTFLDIEGAERAACRLESAALEATRAADRLDDAVYRLTLLVGSGYGNVAERLLEALEKQDAGEPAKHPDTEILDQFEAMSGSLDYCDADDVPNHWRAYGYAGSNEGIGRTVREAMRAAIDAARKEVRP